MNAGEFRRLRAASFFPSDGKETKGSPGDGSGWTLRVHIRPSLSPLAFGHLPLTRGVSPRTPVTGVTPCSGQNISGAQKQECLGAVPSGPLGPGFTKIGTGAVPHLRLSLPSQRSRPGSRRRGGPMWPPAGRSGTGPYGKNGVFPIFRRGGTLSRPEYGGESVRPCAKTDAFPGAP